MLCTETNNAPPVRSSAHISRLPNELLVEIFCRYQTEGWPHPYSYFYHFPDPDRAFDGHWVRLMLVCRHWRETAVTTPRLWRAFEIRRELRWAELALARSATSPIHVVVVYPAPMLQCLALLQPHAHRLRTLLIPSFEVPDYANHLQSFVGLNMPQLVQLEAAVEGKYGSRPAIPEPVDFSPAHFPSLRQLRLSDVIIPWVPSVFAQLRCLDLRDPVFRDVSLSFSRLLHVLNDCVELEELQLHGVVSQLADVGPTPITLNLPKLRKVAIGDVDNVIRPFLSCIPATADLSIEVDCTVPAGQEHATLIDGGIAALFPAGIGSCYSIFRAATDGQVSAVDDCGLHGWNDSAAFRLTLRLADGRDCEGCLPHLLSQFQAMFSGSPIQSFATVGDVSLVSSYAWGRFFTAFPALRRFRAEGPSDCPLSLLSSLAQSGYADSDSGTDRQDAGRNQAGSPRAELGAVYHSNIPDIVCPELRSLVFDLVGWSVGFPEVLVTVLRRRAAGGLPLLEEIELEMLVAQSEELEAEFDSAMDLYDKDIEELVSGEYWYSCMY